MKVIVKQDQLAQGVGTVSRSLNALVRCLF